jgi:hypothetical protein
MLFSLILAPSLTCVSSLPAVYLIHLAPSLTFVSSLPAVYLIQSCLCFLLLLPLLSWCIIILLSLLQLLTQICFLLLLPLLSWCIIILLSLLQLLTHVPQRALVGGGRPGSPP